MADTVQPRPEASDFITKTRALATLFIQAADTTASLESDLMLSGWANPEEKGGLTGADFKGNERVSRDSILAFYQVIGTLLGSLTDEQRAAIYAVKR